MSDDANRHPLTLADSGPTMEWRRAFDDLLAALTKLGVCGVAVIGVVPVGENHIVVSSVANQSPVNRRVLVEAMENEIERWRAKLELSEGKKHDLH